MRFSGAVNLRPVRVGFLVPPNDLAVVSRVAQLSACLWGGRYNPIIPFFETGGERWHQPHAVRTGLDVARGYVDFFEPDTLVEAVPGMAEKLGWDGNDRGFGLSRTIQLGEFYEIDDRGRVEFAAGIDICEVMQELYDTDYKYERRHKRPFADIEQQSGNAFFDLVGGRYPTDKALSYIQEGYQAVFSPEKLEATSGAAMKLLREGHAGPLWISRHGLEESFGTSAVDNTFHIFDPTNSGDVIDYWNSRLVNQRIVPISLNWIAEQRDFVCERIKALHRPIPGNPSGMMFHSTIEFGSSISDETCSELIRTVFSDLPKGSFYTSRPPLLWLNPSGHMRQWAKIRASGKAVSFDEELSSDRYVKLPAPAPSFLNATRSYARARWINLISTGALDQRPDPVTVYPSNLWSPKYPRLGSTGELRIGREGWALHIEHNIGYSLWKPQDGRTAIIGWLQSRGIEAVPSEEGQIASRVIATAETLRGCGMFADRKTLKLLNEMAESQTEVSRDGTRKVKHTPDRSKHYREVFQHFKDRSKRSFGYWNKLDHFLDCSVFRVGLRVQCPVCAYYNWFALNSLSFKPTCVRCLNQFEFSQKPEHLHCLEWYYRITGPFAAPDYARGAYAVALTLRALTDPQTGELTWSTGLRLNPPGCEIDFIAWHRGGGRSVGERDEPTLVLGEAKSFGVGSIDGKAINSLRRVAELFPGATMVVSSLREIGEYTLGEIAHLRWLALWGRQNAAGSRGNKLIVLTGAELFAQHSIVEAWKGAKEKNSYTSIDLKNLSNLAELTQRRYLGLQSRWIRQNRNDLPECMEHLLNLIKSRGGMV